MMEDENGFLSREDDDKANVFKVLNKVLTDLNQNKMTTIIEGETTIYLKIITHFNDPPEVYDHLVPILNEQFCEVPIEVWDLTTQQVLPFINGINHISRIAAESDVEIGLVKACIQNLLYYQVVDVLPLIKYCNVYTCTRNLQRLTKDPALALACRRVESYLENKKKSNFEESFFWQEICCLRTSANSNASAAENNANLFIYDTWSDAEITLSSDVAQGQ